MRACDSILLLHLGVTCTLLCQFQGLLIERGMLITSIRGAQPSVRVKDVSVLEVEILSGTK